MRGTKKKLAAILTAVAVMGLTLMGCGQELTPADQNVNALLELSAKNNPKPMMDLLGYETEEDVYNAFFEDGIAAAEDDSAIVDELVATLAGTGMEIPEDEIQEFSDAMTDLVNKVTYTTEITSEDKDLVVVTVKVHGISEEELEQVMADAIVTMTDGLSNLTDDEIMLIQSGDMSPATPYMQQYLKDVIAGVKAMEPMAEANEFTVNCEKLAVEVGDKEKIAWLPQDMNQFERKVEAALYQ